MPWFLMLNRTPATQTLGCPRCMRSRSAPSRCTPGTGGEKARGRRELASMLAGAEGTRRAGGRRRAQARDGAWTPAPDWTLIRRYRRVPRSKLRADLLAAVAEIGVQPS